MKVLLDTCTFLWAVADPDRLPARVAEQLLAPDNDVFVSAASAWEIAIKAGTGRLSIRGAADRFVREQREIAGFAALPIDEESALHVSRLPALHRDPFDRIVAAQADVERMVLVASDRVFDLFPVQRLW